MRGEWRFHAAGEIIFGRGTVRRVGEAVCRLGAQRALLVTDQGLVAAGLHEEVELSLARSGVAVDCYDGGQANGGGHGSDHPSASGEPTPPRRGIPRGDPAPGLVG
ncbi:MAG: iron-containing alcohol dehydrogenase [Chloroflexi bacterium]|nr:iron-containing alcohol dehydrogenase [Chloroflexota bacterium]